MKRKHWLGATGAALMAVAAFGAPQAHAATSYTILAGTGLAAGQVAYDKADCNALVTASSAPNNTRLDFVVIDVSGRRDQDLTMSWTGTVPPSPATSGLVPQFFSGSEGSCQPIYVAGLRGSSAPGSWTIHVPIDAKFLAVSPSSAANVTLTVN